MTWRLLALLALLVAPCAAGDRLYEWKGHGVLHGIPVAIEAEVERTPQTWHILFHHAPRPGDHALRVYLELEGTWEREAPDRLVFLTPYANARVVFSRVCDAPAAFPVALRFAACSWRQTDANIDLALEPLRERSEPEAP